MNRLLSYKIFLAMVIFSMIIVGEEKQPTYLENTEIYIPNYGDPYTTCTKTCWVYTSYMVLDYFGKNKIGGGHDKALFEEIYKLGSMCDVNSFSGPCNRTGGKNISEIMQYKGLYPEFFDRTLTFEEVKKKIDAQTPIYAGLKKLSVPTEQHVVLIKGYFEDNGTKDLFVYDPSTWLGTDKPNKYQRLLFSELISNSKQDFEWFATLAVSKSFPPPSCPNPNYLQKTINPIATNTCGTDGILDCDGCDDMNSCIVGVMTSDYFDVFTTAPFSDQKSIFCLGATDDKPNGVFIRNGQSRLYDFDIPQDVVTTEAFYTLQITFMISNKVETLQSLFNSNGEYFSAEVYVDGQYQGPIRCKYSNLYTSSSDQRISQWSTITKFLRLKTTSTNIKVVITSGKIKTDADQAVVVIKSFDLSKYERPISTETTGSGSDDNHNTGKIPVGGVSGTGESYYINGNTVTVPGLDEATKSSHPNIDDNWYFGPAITFSGTHTNSDGVKETDWLWEPNVALREASSNDYLKVAISWGDGTQSDWCDQTGIPFVHSYSNAKAYTIKGIKQTKGNVLGWLGGWSSDETMKSYSITIDPPTTGKVDVDATIDKKMLSVTFYENNLRFIPYKSNLRLSAPPEGKNKKITGNILINWGDGVITQDHVLSTDYTINSTYTWNKYTHVYNKAGSYNIKILYGISYYSRDPRIRRSVGGGFVSSEAVDNDWEEQTSNKIFIPGKDITPILNLLLND